MPPEPAVVDELAALANRLRRHVIKMTYYAGSGHPGGSLSAADMIAVLYFHRRLRIDPARPDWPDRDRFILSKGHACPVWYAALAERGYFPVDDLWGLRQTYSHLQGHPDMRKTPGVDMTAGPLGSGLSAGAGIADGRGHHRAGLSHLCHARRRGFAGGRDLGGAAVRRSPEAEQPVVR